MNDALKQFSTDVADALKAALASESIADFVKKAKDSGDDRTL